MILRYCWIAVLITSSAVTAYARSRPANDMLPSPGGLPVTIVADMIDYDRKNSILFASGSVTITQGERILHADRVKINVDTKDTDASGNVLLEEMGDRIECDSFSINLDTQLGSVNAARIFIKEQNIHISGNDIQRLGINTYKVEKGTITTCDGANPAWRIDAENIDVTIDGYAVVKKSTLRLKGLPVFYLPVALFPVKTTRQTGFLFPEISYSSDEGVQLNNSFFWALSDNTDATLWLDAATRRGVGTGLEYRFKLADNTSGTFYGYAINERSHYFDHEYRNRRDRDRTRYYGSFEGEHYFNADAYVKAQASYVSDREMYGDYRSEIRRSAETERKMNLGSREKEESVFFFNKNWSRFNLLLTANTYKNLITSGPETVQRLPQIVFSSLTQPIANTGLFYKIDSSYDYLWREEGEKGHRIDIFPKISLPLSLNGWLKHTTVIGLRGMYYIDIDDDDGLDTDGFFPSITSELTAKFYRIYTVNRSWLKKIRHSIEPGVRYEYIATEDQTDYPEFDIPERFFRRHEVSYFIKNRLSALLRGSDGSTDEREIGYFLIGNAHNIQEPKGGIYRDGDRDEDFSDLFGELRIGIFPRLYLKIKAAYNPYDNFVRYHNYLLSWSTLRGSYIQFQYRYYKKFYEVFDLRGNLKLTNALSLFFDSRYDGYGDEDVDTEVGIDYASQCWGSKFSIETSSGTGGRSSDVSFHYSFYLKGLGENIRRSEYR